MVKLAVATNPEHIPDKLLQALMVVYAALLVVMATLQLFAFDEFLQLFESFNLTTHVGLAYGFATLIVIMEVFALPYLLGARLSPLMRVKSIASGPLVAILWLWLSLRLGLSTDTVANIGIFGTKVELSAGLGAILVSTFLCALSGVIVWHEIRRRIASRK